MSKKQKANKENNPEKLQEKENTAEKTAEQTDKASQQEEEQQQQEQQEEKPEEPTADDKMKKLEKDLSEATDKYLRLFSEFDNFRKRSIKERLELTNTATASIISSFLPVLDDLERAAKLHSESQEKDPSGEGLILIYNKFKNILSQKGVEEIKTIGEPFNTDFHDAITHIPAQDESQKGKIVDEVQKGYKLKDKVIRFAQVVVAN